MDLISVIIPAYNHERYIGQAVQSVLSQSHANLELIIINDGSTDNTHDIIQAFSDPRIRYVSQHNQDAFNALNRGIAMATGEFIAINNSDDVFGIDRLQTLLCALEMHDADLVFSKVRAIDADGLELSENNHSFLGWYRQLLEKHRDHHDLHHTMLLGNLAVTTSNFLFKKSCAQRLNLFRPLHFAHDYDFILRALARSDMRVHFVEHERSLSYRVHAQNTINSDLNAAQIEVRELLLEHRQRLPAVYQPILDSRLQGAAARPKKQSTFRRWLDSTFPRPFS